MNLEKGRRYKIKLKKYHHFYSIPAMGRNVCEFVVKSIRKTKGANKTEGHECQIEWVKIPLAFEKTDYPFSMKYIARNNKLPFWFIGDADYEIVWLGVHSVA